ncbi:hypothetical protein D3C84_927460 [compost metagenome]
MLPDRGQKRFDQFRIRANDQSRISLQLQHIQQLLRLTLQGNSLQMLICLQQVMQRHPVSAQPLDRRGSARHVHRIERH